MRENSFSTASVQKRYNPVIVGLLWRILFALLVSGLLVMALFATNATSH